MHAQTYLLVIAEEQSALTRAANGLSPSDIQVTRASDAEGGIQILEGDAQLSIVAIDGELVDDADELLRRIRDRHRDLPVIWCHAGEKPPRFSAEPPQAMLPSDVDTLGLAQTAQSLLFEDYFPRSVVHGLLNAGNAVLAKSCETSVEAGTPWLRQTEALPGNVHAYIAFWGDGVTGHLLTSGTIEVLCALGERLGFDPEEGIRQVAIDMAGEIGNQVLGRIKSICGDVMNSVRMGVPVVWVGEGIHAHFSSEKPNLSVKLTTEDGPVYLNLGFNALNLSNPDGGLDDHMGAGELALF